MVQKKSYYKSNRAIDGSKLRTDRKIAFNEAEEYVITWFYLQLKIGNPKTKCITKYIHSLMKSNRDMFNQKAIYEKDFNTTIISNICCRYLKKISTRKLFVCNDPILHRSNVALIDFVHHFMYNDGLEISAKAIANTLEDFKSNEKNKKLEFKHIKDAIIEKCQLNVPWGFAFDNIVMPGNIVSLFQSKRVDDLFNFSVAVIIVYERLMSKFGSQNKHVPFLVVERELKKWIQIKLLNY